MIYRKVVQAIKKAGWQEVRSSGSHHQFRKPGFDEVATVPDHGNKDISPFVLGRIEKVTGLSLKR